MSLQQDYIRIVRSAWDGVSRSDDHTLTLEHGRRYAASYWKRHTGKRRVPWLSVKQTSGNRYSWVKGNELSINVGNGWEELNHAFSHFVNRWLGHKPHGDRHLELERDGALMIRERYLPITVALPVVEPKPKKPRWRQETIEDWADRIGCIIDDVDYRKYGEIYVHPPYGITEDQDPFRDDHVAHGRREARELLKEYEHLLQTKECV